MVSSITILGQAGDLLESNKDFRYVIVESCEAFDERCFISKIPVRYWNRGTSKILLDIPKGDMVCVFGRLESDPDIGLYVQAEQLRHFSKN